MGRGGTCMPQSLHRGQRKMCGILFFPSTIWVLGIILESLGSAASSSTHFLAGSLLCISKIQVFNLFISDIHRHLLEIIKEIPCTSYLVFSGGNKIVVQFKEDGNNGSVIKNIFITSRIPVCPFIATRSSLPLCLNSQ